MCDIYVDIPAASTVLSPVGMPSPRLPNEPFSSMQATLPITTASMPQTICEQFYILYVFISDKKNKKINILYKA